MTIDERQWSAVRVDKLKQQVTQTSGSTVCVEGLRKGRWVGLYWSADARPPTESELCEDEAFEISLDGVEVHEGWQWVDATHRRGDRGTIESLVTLENPEFHLEAVICTALDGTPVLTRWLNLRNTGKGPAAITSIFPWVARAWASRRYEDHALADPFTLGHFTRSDWAYEGWFEWGVLDEGSTTIACDKGQGFDDPFFVLRNEPTGEHWICNLAWSANWVIDFQRVRDREKTTPDSVLFRIGPFAKCPQRVIDPGETVTSPRVHLGYVSGDLDLAVQSMHDHLRRSVLPTMRQDRSHRIQYSVPGDQGYPAALDEKTLIDNVEIAATIGAELFIVDAGWWEVVGEWTPSRERFPGGLEPVIEHARSKGLLFGLYAEMEGGRGNWPESSVYREHPDWFGPKNVLDLAKSEVAQYVERELTGLIERYDLDLFRLDYNPLFTYEGSTTQRHGYEENNYWRYYEAFCSIFDRVRARYPDLILQQAAAGGARNDLGTASTFHEDYLTDGLRVPHVLRVYAGQSLSLPPEAFVIGLGADGGIARGHPMSLDTNLRTIFTLSTPWVFAGMMAPDLQRLGGSTVEWFRHYVKIYKEFIRPLLPNCRAYHHAPISRRGGVCSSPWFAMEYSSSDRTKAWATIVRMSQSPDDEFTYKPRGLSRERTYVTTFDAARERIEIDGLRLVQDGLTIRLDEVGASELLLFEGK